ncbi:MAG: AsmA family protein [Cyclobacteriaceae bacterium]|nr:AsmA family protein [Cyclobacteriaceae bacterium]
MSRAARWTLYGGVFFIVLIGILYAAAQYYRPRILALVNAELKKSINGDIQIGDLDFTIFERFPAFSVKLSDIYLRGPRYPIYKKDFFTAEQIFIHVQPIHLLRGTIDLKSLTVRKASVFIFRAADGYTNLDVFKRKTPVDTANKPGPLPSFLLEELLFENTKLLYFDSVKRKSYGANFERMVASVEDTDSSRLITLAGKVEFAGLMFNEQKGSYLKGKKTQLSLNMEFIPGMRQLLIKPSSIGFEKSTVELSGAFVLSTPPSFKLAIRSPSLDYPEGLTIVTKALNEKLSKFEISKPVVLAVDIDGPLSGEPKVDVRFSSVDNDFKTGKIQINEFSFNGFFTNHLDSTKAFDDYNSSVQLDTLSGKVAGLPTRAHVVLTNLKDPLIDLESAMQVNLTDLNHPSDTSKLHFSAGSFSSRIRYVGTLAQYLNHKTTQFDGKLKGHLTLTDAAFVAVNDQKRIEKLNALLEFDEKKFDIQKIEFIANGNPVTISGNVMGFIPFFFEPEKKGTINLDVYSPKLNLASFIKKKKKSSAKAPKRNHQKVADLIDLLNKKVQFLITIKVDELVKENFTATKLEGKLGLFRNNFSGGPLKMNAAGGSVQVSLKLDNLDQPENPVELTASVKDADIKKFFMQFQNFSQKTITAENLTGKISADVNLKGRVDDQFNVLMPALTGHVDLRIKNGKLVEFAPLQNMSNFLFKKRDFSEVEFAEINGRFDLQGQSLNIKRMEIESSVLSLFIEGKYSLADSTDLSIQIPLSNLKRRDKDYKPENVGTDARVGPSVFLRARHRDGKISIGYDLFKKFRKN